MKPELLTIGELASRLRRRGPLPRLTVVAGMGSLERVDRAVDALRKARDRIGELTLVPAFALSYR